MLNKNVMEFNMNNFEDEVMNSDKPVIVDFWASWCGPCRMMAPVMDDLANELEGKAKVGKINVDTESELASKFSIMSIPTILVFKDGKVINSSSGVRPKEHFINMIK